MIPALVVSALLSCNASLASLIPGSRGPGRYTVCTTELAADAILHLPAMASVHASASDMLEAMDAFGTASPLDRAAIARLYGGRRVRVQRGWAETRDRFESFTLLSPYPDASRTHLLPGTLVIVWTLDR